MCLSRYLKTTTSLMIVLCALSSVTPLLAHHSQAAFDATREITIKGTVHRLDWKNPHIYLIVETLDEEGNTILQQVEGLAVTQALVDGLDRNALTAGTPVTVRANPNRRGGGRTVRGLYVTTEDGRVHPFYQRAAGAPRKVPAAGLTGKWAPSLAESVKVFGIIYGNWKLTEAAKAGKLVGACEIEPVPFLTVINEMRSIEVGEDRVVFHHNNSGDLAERVVHLGMAGHPDGIEPSRMGHSIGHWEGKTLVIDTVAYAPHESGLFTGVPAGLRKHTVEHLTLSEDGFNIRYEFTMEDPDYLVEPMSFSMLWEHRPDLESSDEPCDQEISDRYLDD